MIVLKIGYKRFLVKRESDAAAMVAKLAGAFELAHLYKDGKELYWPDDSPSEISIVRVPAEQILARPPDEVVVEVQAARRKLNGRQQLLLEGGTQRHD